MVPCPIPGHISTVASQPGRCRECQIASNVRAARKRRRRDRLAAIEAYGGKCACCGEAEPVFLTIDHEDGDGAAHRQQLQGTPIASWLRARGWPPGFRVLCFNCNCAIAITGTCPHQAAVQLPSVCTAVVPARALHNA